MVRKEKDDFLTPQRFAPANCLIRVVTEGTISSKDLDLFSYVESAEEAWQKIADAVGLW